MVSVLQELLTYPSDVYRIKARQITVPVVVENLQQMLEAVVGRYDEAVNHFSLACFPSGCLPVFVLSCELQMRVDSRDARPLLP